MNFNNYLKIKVYKKKIYIILYKYKIKNIGIANAWLLFKHKKISRIKKIFYILQKCTIIQTYTNKN